MDTRAHVAAARKRYVVRVVVLVSMRLALQWCTGCEPSSPSASRIASVSFV